MLVADTGYTVGAANTATVAVNDISIPELSIADAEDIVAGKNAEYMVTSSIPFIGDLSVAYTPVKAGGNFLDESDGTDSTKTNTNSGVDRTITLTFAKDGDNYTATLYVATADDVSDTDGGTITLTLKADQQILLNTRFRQLLVKILQW